MIVVLPAVNIFLIYRTYYRYRCKS